MYNLLINFKIIPIFTSIYAYNFKGDFMSKRIMLIEIIIVSIVGTLLHFVYDWSGQNTVIGFMGAVNESTWEHLKLLFWPLFVISTYEYFAFYKNRAGFLMSRFVATVIGMLFIAVLFYSVSGIIGKSIDFFNIALYFMAVILTFFLSKIFLKNGFFESKGSNRTALILFLSFAVLFIIFTKRPPSLGIFQVP